MRFLSCCLAVAVASIGWAQVAGGQVYGQPQGGPRAEERARRVVSKDDVPPPGSSFVEASVLLNVKADEYVALFGVSQEGATPEECRQKMDAAIGQFSEDLRLLGAKPSDVDVDFIAQNRIYGYDVAGNVATEKIVGFELKKNVAVHYRNRSFLEKALAEASRLGIFDLVKVDYIVKDLDDVRSKLMATASQIVRQKAATDERLLGVKLGSAIQVVAERYGSYYPNESYSNYAAYEAEGVYGGGYQGLTVKSIRKPRTFYFNGLNAKEFDRVINPVVVEPVVQFTVYLKVRYGSGATSPGIRPKK